MFFVFVLITSIFNVLYFELKTVFSLNLYSIPLNITFGIRLQRLQIIHGPKSLESVRRDLLLDVTFLYSRFMKSIE